MAERALNSSVSLSPSHEKSYESSTFDVFSTSTGNVNSFSSPATNTRTTSGFAVAASSISRQQRRSPKTPPLHSQRMNKTISTSGKLSSLGAPAMPGVFNRKSSSTSPPPIRRIMLTSSGSSSTQNFSSASSLSSLVDPTSTLLSPSQIRYARYAESILKPNSMEEVRVSAPAAENIKLTYVRILGCPLQMEKKLTFQVVDETSSVIYSHSTTSGSMQFSTELGGSRRDQRPSRVKIENLFAESKCSVNVKGDNYILFFDVTKEKPFTKPQPVFSVCFNTAFIKHNSENISSHQRRSALLLRDIDCNDEDLLPFITPNKLQVELHFGP
mmetsp:Transcript_11878/g.19054  ORF Transcript_11878/g.19054 Transcript_11878/m.19054 type:complete len:328 (-) Transcript_11878:274-1257(-)